jgi:hypothetical protein
MPLSGEIAAASYMDIYNLITQLPQYIFTEMFLCGISAGTKEQVITGGY